jgi:hypothetical protein
MFLTVQMILKLSDLSAVDRLAAVSLGPHPPVVFAFPYFPVLPGSIAINLGDGEIVRDDRGGRLVASTFDLHDDVGTVNYRAGFLYFAHDFFDGSPPNLDVTWDYDPLRCRSVG